MLACRIHAKDDLRIESMAAPAPGPGEVLLRLGAGGICASDLHYYYDASAAASSGKLYEDDGATVNAYGQGKYELARFSASASAGGFEIGIDTEVGQAWQAVARSYAVKVHNVASRPRSVTLDGKPLAARWDARTRTLELAVPARAAMKAKLAVAL